MPPFLSSHEKQKVRYYAAEDYELHGKFMSRFYFPLLYFCNYIEVHGSHCVGEPPVVRS